MNQLYRVIYIVTWALLVAFSAAVAFFAATDDGVLAAGPLHFLVNPLVLGIIFTVGIAFLVTLTYVLFITPIGQIRREISLFLTGAKVEPGEIQAVHPDLVFVTNFFKKSLEILKTFKTELQSGRVLKSEVELAADLQKTALEKVLPVIPSIDIVARSKSATEVGGDAYDLVDRGDNYYIYIGDVTGHGVASGFVMMIVNALVAGFTKLMISGSEILSRTNEVMKPRVKKNMLMSMLMLRWNEAEKRLFMTGAGHEYFIVYKASARQAVKIKSGGVALGMARDIAKALREAQIKIEVGDLFIMYTDGITEARNGRDPNATTMFGIDRLVATIEGAPVKSAQGIFNHITIALSQFMGYNHKQFDDVTLIVGHYHGGNRENIVATPTEIPAAQITEWRW